MGEPTDPSSVSSDTVSDDATGPVGGERWAMGVLAVNVVAVPALALVGIAGRVPTVDLVGLLAAVVLVVGLCLIQMSVLRSRA